MAPSDDLLASLPPDLEETEIAALLQRHYGLSGALRRLTSERDLNLHLATPAGGFVVKVANRAEPRQVTDFQTAALLHLEGKGLPRLGGRTLGVKCHLDWRPPIDDLLAGGGFIQITNPDGQAAGRCEKTHFVKIQRGVFEALDDAGFKCAGQTEQGLGWQLFGAKFNKKIFAHCADSWCRAMTSWASAGAARGKPRARRESK